MADAVGGSRTIVHVDMDAFFAAVEQRDNPELRGRPVIVGGNRDSSRGVVSTCSYEARKFGIHSAMPIAQAVKLCPHGVFVPGSRHKYGEVSRQIHEVFETFTPVVEMVSIDEAFLDMTGCEHFHESLEAMGHAVKEAVRARTQLTASLGAAPNRFLAKLASEMRKPDGLVVIRPDRVQEMLDALPVAKLWGVGERATTDLAAMGVTYVRQLRQMPIELLEGRFGRMGRGLYHLARGIDNTPVSPGGEAKSVSAETTFAQDTTDQPFLMRALSDLAHQVGRRVRAAGTKGRTISIKVRYADFSTITRSRSLDVPIDDDPQIRLEARRLLQETEQGRKIRLLGIALSNFRIEQQMSLLDGEEESLAKTRMATDVLDKLEGRFGPRVVMRGDRM